MARLGISLYPEHSTLDKEKAYVTLAAKYGFKRIFTCLLSVDKERGNPCGIQRIDRPRTFLWNGSHPGCCAVCI